MSRTREIWTARWTSVGLGYRPSTVVPDGASQPGPYKVTIKSEIPERGCRVVETEMDPEQAEMLGKALIEYADKCRTQNRRYGP